MNRKSNKNVNQFTLNTACRECFKLRIQWISSWNHIRLFYVLRIIEFFNIILFYILCYVLFYVILYFILLVVLYIILFFILFYFICLYYILIYFIYFIGCIIFNFDIVLFYNLYVYVYVAVGHPGYQPRFISNWWWSHLYLWAFRIHCSFEHRGKFNAIW